MSNISSLGRIGKVLSHRGVGSRRYAEKIISQKRVYVNKQLVTHPSFVVLSSDVVEVDSTPVLPQKLCLWRYHKPRGVLTTHHDPQGRPTICEHLPQHTHIVTVGRLDYDSQGLLLLTNNGSFARFLEIPQEHVQRIYHVYLSKPLKPLQRKLLKKGVRIGSFQYKPIDVWQETNSKGQKMPYFVMGLFEGKNREIRRIMNFFGITVQQLIRVSYGPFSLCHLTSGSTQKTPIPSFLMEKFFKFSCTTSRPPQRSGLQKTAPCP